MIHHVAFFLFSQKNLWTPSSSSLHRCDCFCRFCCCRPIISQILNMQSSATVMTPSSHYHQEFPAPPAADPGAEAAAASPGAPAVADAAEACTAARTPDSVCRCCCCCSCLGCCCSVPLAPRSHAPPPAAATGAAPPPPFAVGVASCGAAPPPPSAGEGSRAREAWGTTPSATAPPTPPLSGAAAAAPARTIDPVPVPFPGGRGGGCGCGAAAPAAAAALGASLRSTQDRNASSHAPRTCIDTSSRTMAALPCARPGACCAKARRTGSASKADSTDPSSSDTAAPTAAFPRKRGRKDTKRDESGTGRRGHASATDEERGLGEAGLG